MGLVAAAGKKSSWARTMHRRANHHSAGRPPVVAFLAPAFAVRPSGAQLGSHPNITPAPAAARRGSPDRHHVRRCGMLLLHAAGSPPGTAEPPAKQE